MPKKANARRYAQAVFEIALEQKELERWQTDLQKIVGVMSDADFLAAMESPKIKFDDKSRLISERLTDISPPALNLVRLLISRNGAGMIVEINRDLSSNLILGLSMAARKSASLITPTPFCKSVCHRSSSFCSSAISKTAWA